MSRISRYELVACPHCGAIHHKPCYSSISVTVPQSVARQTFKCVECGRESERDAFKFLKFVPKDSTEVEADKYAQTLYIYRMGPKPEPLARKSFRQKLKELFARPVKNEWEMYPPLN